MLRASVRRRDVGAKLQMIHEAAVFGDEIRDEPHRLALGMELRAHARLRRTCRMVSRASWPAHCGRPCHATHSLPQRPLKSDVNAVTRPSPCRQETSNGSSPACHEQLGALLGIGEDIAAQLRQRRLERFRAAVPSATPRAARKSFRPGDRAR